MKTVAVEDLVTEVCECFSNNVWKISQKITPKLKGLAINDMILWYSKRSQKEKRKISEMLLDIMNSK